MKKFNYQHQLKEIIENKQLTEVFLHGAPTYIVAYILDANEKYLTFAHVSSSGEFGGVTICRQADVFSVSIDTLYLNELVKQISRDAILKQALHDVRNIKEFTFEGFVLGMEKSGEIVDVGFENDESVAGRIVGYDGKVIAVDEYAAGRDQRLGRSFYTCANILRLSVDIPWLRTISRSVVEREL